MRVCGTSKLVCPPCRCIEGFHSSFSENGGMVFGFGGMVFPRGYGFFALPLPSRCEAPCGSVRCADRRCAMRRSFLCDENAENEQALSPPHTLFPLVVKDYEDNDRRSYNGSHGVDGDERLGRDSAENVAAHCDDCSAQHCCRNKFLLIS